jgi:hypothetical protein
MDVARGSASAVSAVELELLAVDREMSDRWFAVHHCSRRCWRSQTHHLLTKSAALGSIEVTIGSRPSAGG